MKHMRVGEKLRSSGGNIVHWVLGGVWGTDNGLHLINNCTRHGVTNASGALKHRKCSRPPLSKGDTFLDP